MKARVLIFFVLFVVMAVYCTMTMINELQASELRWLWIVIYAVMLGICVTRSVQLCKELIQMIKEEKKK